MVGNSESQTLQAVRKLKVDCLYKKSTHFNAARRLKTGSERFRTALIVGTIAASFSTIMNVGIWDKIPGENTWVQVIVNILGALGGFLILYTTTFSDYKNKIDIANKHENIANDLNLIFKRIRNTEARYLDSLINDSGLSDALKQLTEDYTTKCSNAPITADEDFLQAKENFEKGYTAEYTDKELNC
ncbi:SLATT domain-containing protein [Ekhidna sp.]|uniref:SLATT domain-containing protein n=1 Tax=Ekhidna sp. TaxID=2608089 RepID=UPI003CCBD4B9